MVFVEGAEEEHAAKKAEQSQRAAILRRFRALLEEQRNRFRSYLAALDKQQTVIESGSAEELLAHVELEEQIVADIFSIQKVIEPLDAMYRTLAPQSKSGDDVPDLKAALENLKNEAAVRVSKNKELLSGRMAAIRSEITALRNNPYAANARRSAYTDSGAASLVDIKG
jgi:hypothetical protein